MIVYSPREFGSMVRREALIGSDCSVFDEAASSWIENSFHNDMTSLPDFAYARVSWHYASANTPDEITRNEAIDVIKTALYRMNIDGLIERAVRAELKLRGYELVEEE